MGNAALWISLLPAVLGGLPDDKSADVYQGARILTAEGPPIERGILIVQDGKIIAVGAEGQVQAPQGARARDCTGKTIIPGLVDTHSHVGIFARPAVPANMDGNEATGPAQPGLRAIDAIYPDDPGIRMAVAGGITTANIMPGSGNVIGGQTLYVKLRGHTVEDMSIKNGKVLGGLKMANGENPKGYGRRQQAPATRMKVAALQREQFLKARDYQQKWNAYRKNAAEGKKGSPPETDLAMEPLVEVLERKRTVHFHSHRADDLLTAVRIAEEFGFEVVLHHVTEGYRVAEELARHHVPLSLTLVDSPGGKLEATGVVEENAAVLEKAGCLVAINTDDFITESRFFLRSGAIAVRGGMSEDAALKALTIRGAQLLHLDERLGSLAKGKDADFVVLSGPPFSVYTKILETFIDGARVFDRAKAADLRYQTGGFALGEQVRLLMSSKLAEPLPDVAATWPEAKTTPSGQTPRLLVLSRRVHTVSQGTINDGAVYIENKRISRVGRRGTFQVPADIPVITADDVTPGLIDAHSVVGVSGYMNIPADQDQDESTDPNQADVRVQDGFNPNEPHLQFIREQGVTVVQALPGRLNVIAGQGGIFRTYGRSMEQMTLRSPSSLLVNLGEIPKQTYPNKFPNTRMGTASLVRSALVQARSNAQKRQRALDEDKRPPRNLKLEALEPVLEGKLPVIFSAHRADDLDTALRLGQEFKLNAVLDSATEGYLLADAIAAAHVPVIGHPTLQRVGALETFNTFLGNAASLADHGVPLAIGTSFEGYVPKTRVLRHEAAIAMVNGLGFPRALHAVTLGPAQILKIDDRFGSIERGKVADLVLYDGDPFEYTTHVTHTIIDGRVIYDRAQTMKLPLIRRALPIVSSDVGCCMGIW
jgi:imidazolonepropionase-like amidohydrolase